MADVVATGQQTALKVFPKWGWVAIGIAVAVVVLIIVVAAAASTATVSSNGTTTDTVTLEDPPLSGSGDADQAAALAAAAKAAADQAAADQAAAALAAANLVAAFDTAAASVGCTACAVAGVYFCPKTAMTATALSGTAAAGYAALVSTYRLSDYDPVASNVTLGDVGATGQQTALKVFPKWGWVAIGIAIAVVVLIIVVAAAASTATVSSAITTTDPGLVEDPPLSGGGVDEGNAAEDLTAVETPAPTSCFEWASWVPNAVDGVPSWVVGNVGTWLMPVATTGTSGSPSLGATNRSQTANDFGEFFSHDPLLDSTWPSLYAAKATADCPGVSTFTQTDDVDEALKFMDVPVCYDFSGVSTAFSPYVNGACTQWPYMGQFALVKNTTA